MTDARLREATTAEISTALGKLFRALPPRKASPAELEESYLIACHRATKHAIDTVVVKLIRGEMEKLSKSFAPSPAELSSAIRDEMDFVRRQVELAQERLALADNRPKAAQFVPLNDRIEAKRRQMREEGRPLLFVVSNHTELHARRREMPAGGTYLALTGEVYGPPGADGQASEIAW